jgi:hypothetical protein
MAIDNAIMQQCLPEEYTKQAHDTKQYVVAFNIGTLVSLYEAK